MEVLDTPAEERFDRLTRIAQRLFKMPIVLISLVDKDRQWFKSSQGVEMRSTARAISFCQYTILSDDALVVEDAQLDPRFASNPLVEGAPHLRFYAGQPINSPDGHRVGTLCMLDLVPRSLTPEDLETLRDLGALVEVELGIHWLSQAQGELRAALESAEHLASIDPVTQAWNRRAIFTILAREIDRAIRFDQMVSVAYVDLDLFKPINDTYGHKVGDLVLKTLTQRLCEGVRLYDSVGRIGGDEFLLVIPAAGVIEGRIVAERVLGMVCNVPVISDDCIIPISVSIGISTFIPGEDKDPASLIDRADHALLSAKRGGRGRIVSAEGMTETLAEAG